MINVWRRNTNGENEDEEFKTEEKKIVTKEANTGTGDGALLKCTDECK